jgi:hypothetical protein
MQGTDGRNEGDRKTRKGADNCNSGLFEGKGLNLRLPVTFKLKYRNKYLIGL